MYCSRLSLRVSRRNTSRLMRSWWNASDTRCRASLSARSSARASSSCADGTSPATTSLSTSTSLDSSALADSHAVSSASSARRAASRRRVASGSFPWLPPPGPDDSDRRSRLTPTSRSSASSCSRSAVSRASSAAAASLISRSRAVVRAASCRSSASRRGSSVGWIGGVVRDSTGVATPNTDAMSRRRSDRLERGWVHSDRYGKYTLPSTSTCRCWGAMTIVDVGRT